MCVFVSMCLYVPVCLCVYVCVCVSVRVLENIESHIIVLRIDTGGLGVIRGTCM